VRLLLHLAAATPLVLLLHAALTDALGADPIAVLTHETGQWALRLLLATLAITPLRLLGNWPVLLQFRRLLGLWSFAYACLHLAIYLGLDLGGYWAQIFEDIVERPFITVGFLAWLLLLPLALTSTRGMMRRLGRRWGQLHRLVYVSAALAVLHFLWLVKADLREPLIYAGLLALLLLFRLPWLQRELARRRRRPG
jgi:methionine sulfoxide reductase heme-binding subunit